MARTSYLGEMLDTLLDSPRRILGTGRGGSLESLCAQLLSELTEVSTFQVASEILAHFDALDDAEKLNFFKYINDELDLTPEDIASAAMSYQASRSADDYRRLTRASEPKRHELLRRLNQPPGATAELVRMREHLRRHLRTNPELARTDIDFSLMLRAWFNRGFLILRQITWDTPASILEKIIAYESVHEIDSWDDLRRRVQPDDRRCFAFFHPAMPGEPLIFVEVALAKGIPTSIQGVLASDRAPLEGGSADTAVFYSISNCQTGLAGISFGNSLIKQVVRDLSLESANLKRFVTLSPIPGFRRWLEAANFDSETADEPALKKLCAAYLTSRNDQNLPIDPVARFHLQNGAQVLAIHSNADMSEAGQSNSFGMMVNYAYEANRISDNLKIMEKGARVPMSSSVRGLARQGRNFSLDIEDSK